MKQRLSGLSKKAAGLYAARLLAFLLLFGFAQPGYAQCGFNENNDWICSGAGTVPGSVGNDTPSAGSSGVRAMLLEEPFEILDSGVIPIPIPGTTLCEIPATTIRIGGETFNLPGNTAAECADISVKNGVTTVDPSSSTTTPTSNEFCAEPMSGGSSSPGDRVAQAANNSIGASTAQFPGTEGGNLGCAIAVSKILECSGYGVGSTLGTVALYENLENDPCYEIVDTGHIDDADLQPGDVLVTKRGTRAGHTGIYVGGGNIVSNSSGGFQGSEPGTVQQNYTVDSWSGVTNRNPGGSAVFRRICP